MNNTHITTLALAATLTLFGQGAHAQSVMGFQVSLDRSGVTQVLSTGDFESVYGGFRVNDILTQTTSEPIEVSREVVVPLVGDPFVDENGDTFAYQKVLVTTRSVTDVATGTTFSGYAGWTDWAYKQTLDPTRFEAGTVKPITGGSITVDASQPADRAITLRLQGKIDDTFNRDLPPASLVLPEGVEVTIGSDTTFDDLGNWTYAASLDIEDFKKMSSTLAFTTQPGFATLSIEVSLNSWSAPTGHYQVFNTDTSLNYDLVPWNPAAVPEPSTWALSALGLGWVLTRARKARVLAA